MCGSVSNPLNVPYTGRDVSSAKKSSRVRHPREWGYPERMNERERDSAALPAPDGQGLVVPPELLPSLRGVEPPSLRDPWICL